MRWCESWKRRYFSRRCQSMPDRLCHKYFSIIPKVSNIVKWYFWKSFSKHCEIHFLSQTPKFILILLHNDKKVAWLNFFEKVKSIRNRPRVEIYLRHFILRRKTSFINVSQPLAMVTCNASFCHEPEFIALRLSKRCQRCLVLRKYLLAFVIHLSLAFWNPVCWKVFNILCLENTPITADYFISEFPLPLQDILNPLNLFPPSWIWVIKILPNEWKLPDWDESGKENLMKPKILPEITAAACTMIHRDCHTPCCSAFQARICWRVHPMLGRLFRPPTEVIHKSRGLEISSCDNGC